MQISKQLFTIGALLFVQAFGHAQTKETRYLSLQEVWEIARARNYEIELAEIAIEQAKGKDLESLSGFFPNISISENYLKSNDPVTVFALKLKQGAFTQQDFALPALNQPAAQDNFTTLVQIKQPLFNLDARYGKSAAGWNVKAKRASAKRARETIFLHVSKAYYGLILAREKFSAIKKAQRSAQLHRNNAKAIFEQGMINKADYLAAEVRLAELKEQQIIARNQIDNAGDALKFLVGLGEENEIMPTDSLGAPVSSASQSNQAATTASRSDLRAMKAGARAANNNQAMQYSSWAPRLNAFGAVEWNASQAFQKDADNWMFGLQLEWNLFEGFGKWGRAKQASAQKQSAELQYRHAVEKAKMEIRIAGRAIHSTQERIIAAQYAVDQADESLRIIEERFNQGLEKTSDLLDKEVALTHARLRHLQAKFDFNVALIELDYTKGAMDIQMEKRK